MNKATLEKMRNKRLRSRKKEILNSNGYDYLMGRNFRVGYFKLSTQLCQELTEKFLAKDWLLMLRLLNISERNTGRLFNTAGNPAESIPEILTAMGYAKGGDSGIKKMKDNDIIRKLPDNKSFKGKSWFLNPYVACYGEPNDESYERFHNSKWRKYYE